MEPVTTENASVSRGAGDQLRGARRIAAYLSEVMDEEVTPAMVFYWAAVKKIRTRKFGAHIVASKSELREDVRGQAA